MEAGASLPTACPRGHRGDLQDERTTQVLLPGFQLKLRLDEAEGIFSTLLLPAKVFVLWRRKKG